MGGWVLSREGGIPTFGRALGKLRLLCFLSTGGTEFRDSVRSMVFLDERLLHLGFAVVAGSYTGVR